ncbi:ABC transporter permease [Nocardiopsis ganjiahuensis]|uniref:ABC transporter permease n=1 Tax=Nocardiopsis ganjiahuensis TaxID=239984 RepID=UPI000348BEA2|nr:ABC transporter permease [Nocardiopsis ganjiahuensis]
MNHRTARTPGAAPAQEPAHAHGPAHTPGPAHSVGFARTLASELVKLATLPAALATALGTAAVSAGLAALTAGADHAPADAAPTVLLLVVFLQVGTVLLGVLTTAGEYTGGQIRTTLTATPKRGRLLAAKTAACFLASALTGAVAVAAGLAGAWAVTDGALVGNVSPWRPAGAAAYLALLGLLAHLVTVVARSLLPPLVSVLGLVLIVSPLLGGLTEHARWLPDRAGQLLYLPGADTVFTPWTGLLVLCGWLLVTGAAAALVFVRRDA